MLPEHNNHDDAIDQTLAALKTAAPPEGMEARILQRLQQHAPAAPFRWSDLLTGSALAAAWWRGALSGAATVMLLAGAVLLAQHGLRSRPQYTPFAAGNNSAVRALAPATLPVAASAPASAGCPAHAQVHRAWVGSTTGETIQAPVHRAQTLSSASFAPSHPAPELPLTAQERALVRLVQTADPKLLAALSPETQAKVDAQEADNYNKFFAPPPPPPTTDVNDIPRTAPKEGEQI
jgi:hypothetical protein